MSITPVVTPPETYVSDIDEAVRRIRMVIETGATVLDLSDLVIHELPRELASATFIQELVVGRTPVVTTRADLDELYDAPSPDPMTKSFRALPFIQYIGWKSLSRCKKVSDLTPLAGMTQLKKLGLSGCEQVSDLTPLIGMTQLRVLDLSNCLELSNLTPLIGMTQLIELDLSRCWQGYDLRPSTVLTQLRSLGLSRFKQIVDLTPLAGMTQLTKLGLSGCWRISDLAPLAKMTQLTKLNLSGCALFDLTPLKALDQLTELDLSGCRRGYDLTPLVGMSQLTKLGLSDCRQISDLTPLAGMTQLTELTLSGCKLVSDLTPILNHSKLEIIVVKETGISLPDYLRDSHDAQSILAWYRAEQLATQRRQLLEVKLLIVGQGRVGKTHLRKRLFGQKILDYYNAGSRSTHSFDFVEDRIRVESPGAAEAEVTVRVWDFGGQPELHSAHRFFLGSQRCFYVLVLAADRPPNGDGPGSNRLNYWLRMIAHYGTRRIAGQPIVRAPVLIVVTRNDEKEARPDIIAAAVDDARRAEFFGANVIGEVAEFGWSHPKDRESQAGQAIWERHEAAADAIRTAGVHKSGAAGRYWRRVLQEYLDARHYLAQAFAGGFDGHPLPRAYLVGDAMERFAELFRGRAGTITELDRIRFRNVCLQMLQNLGDVHWVGSAVENEDALAEPQEWTRWLIQDTAFNPEWVKWPLYTLLQLEESGGVRPGVVPHRNIVRILGRHPASASGENLYERLPFSDEDRQRVLTLMAVCRLAFDVTDVDGLLIPDLLRPIPESEVPLEAGAWTYTMPFLPEKVFLRFVGERYRLIEQVHRNRAVGHFAGHPVVIEARYSPSGSAWPHLILRSPTCEPVPASVADGFRDVIDGVFLREGFDPSGYRLTEIQATPPVGIGQCWFRCLIQKPTRAKGKPEYDPMVVFDGVDLAAQPDGSERHDWVHKKGLYRLWLLLQQPAGRWVHVARLDPDMGRGRRPDAPTDLLFLPASRSPGRGQTKFAKVSTRTLNVMLNKAKKDVESMKVQLKRRLDGMTTEQLETRHEELNELEEESISRGAGDWEKAVGQVRASLIEATEELKLRMGVWKFPAERLLHFDSCKESNCAYFRYPHDVVWRCV